MLRTGSLIGLVAAVLSGCGDNDDTRSDAPKAADAATPVDGTECTVVTPRPMLDTLMTGELVIGAAQKENVVPLTIPQDRSILFTTVRENEASPQYGGVQCFLHEADTSGTPPGIRCRRNTAGTDTPGSTGELHIRWTVATFGAGVTVQRGVTNTGFTNPATITLPMAADPASSFVLLGGIVVGGGGWGSNEFQRARLVDATTLDLRATVAGSDVAWQVVTMEGASVQRGTTALGATDTTGEVPVAPGGDFILASYTSDNASSVAASILMLRAERTATGIRFTRSQPGAVLDVSWEAIRLPFFSRTFTTQLAAGEATKEQAISGLPAASSVAIASGQAVLGPSGGSTDYAGASLDLLGEAAVSLTVAEGAVTVERAASSAAAAISWTAIDFVHDNCAEF